MLLLAGAVLLGLSASSNYGESSPGYLAQALYQRGLLEARVFGDTADKVESGAGYILGGEVDLHEARGPLFGLGYRYRDGGAWIKRSGWLRGGYVQDGVAVILAADLNSINRVSAVELRLRQVLGRVLFESRAGVSCYDEYSECGLLAALSIGVTFKETQ